MNINNVNIIIILITIIAILGAILLFIFYLWNLQRLLNEVSPTNRLVPSANVWLMLIPLFSIVYSFILYPKICDSVKNEFQARGMAEKGDFGKAVGISMAILGVLSLLPFIQVLVLFSAIVNIILFIVFWVKMAGYKNQLMAMPKADGGISSNPDLLD